MKPYKYIITAATSFTLGSCQLLEPGDIVNPNVDEETFVSSPHAMTSWVNGANRTFAEVIGSYCELMEIISDDYMNCYTQSSKVFDYPTLLYTDADVTNLQRYVGRLRETAIQGLDKVAPADDTTTDAQRFTLWYIKGYSYLLAGECFRGLPVEDGGEIKDATENLNLAVSTFMEALNYAQNDNDKAFIYTLLARTYYRLGDKSNAVSFSDKALAISTDFIRQVEFDGDNGVISSIQEYLYGGSSFGTAFQPLPRLDFLDPKYFQKSSSTEARPITIAKAEELYLIKAEAAIADGDLTGAKSLMEKLLALVNSRPVETDINDQLENRHNEGYQEYPNSSDYKVAASADDELRSSLVLDRQSPNLISVPYISGTSVTTTMIETPQTVDGLLEVLYLMRQEIFMAEGRRATDLGIRLPVCETEAANTPSAADYTEALIPSFIPQDRGLDAFTLDKNSKTVIITHNMNRIIVKNKLTEYVAPFFK